MTEAMFPEKRRRFFGASIDLLTMGETLSAVEQAIERRLPTQHVVVNVAKLVMMRKDPELRDIVNSCSIINVDGQGIVWGARWLGQHVPERVAGIDLFLRLVKLSPEKGYRVYFLGATDDVVNRVVETFQERFPKLKIAGRRNGYFAESEEREIAEEIRRARTDILFVGMSSPKKEYFLQRNLQEMNVPFSMGVGGSFDVVAGKTRRAPAWMQRTGLEWFYRFASEPRRMWRRYLASNSIFLGMLLKAKILGKEKCDCD